jgi:hypothetical protein
MKAHTQSDLLEIAERLGNQAKMLEALLQACCAERLEGFATLSKEDMGWYTLHCAEMAGEVREGLGEMVQMLQGVQA